MLLNVYSVYDSVARQSIFITMHHTESEAIRSFKAMLEDESLKSKRSDLQLIFLGLFNPCDPCFSSIDSLVIFPSLEVD